VRPHVWLTGGPGSGKSTILNRFVHLLLGGLDVFAQGASTEAGIRQRLCVDARPVLIDESESNEENEIRRTQGVLSLIRQASTESDAQTLKGTAGGEAMRFHIRSMFALASIQVGLKQQADRERERITVLTLRSKGRDDAEGEGHRHLEAELGRIRRDRTCRPACSGAS
jgi:putative DNA primase/helicase